MTAIPVRYIPRTLTNKDKIKQKKMLAKSRKLYKKGKYFTRPRVSSFKNKPSSHVENAKKLYNVDTIGATEELERKTGCSRESLAKIINKGEGAYFSSGSRPNQTAQSWGVARLASAITSGKAAAIDYSILENGCNKKSMALSLAKKAVKKYGRRTQKVRHPHVNM
jgi:hypothetical protein